MAPRGHIGDVGAPLRRFHFDLTLLTEGSSGNRLQRRRDATKDEILWRLVNGVERRP
jgi:hypothetical protein